MLSTARDLLIFLLGFGLIVFIHELGHFLAARWAGIRVLAFAIGFGPAACSYRRGMGFRAGSSEREYLARSTAHPTPGVSPTEYRLNVLPFGGYVKMLGQDDLRPDAVSDAPDSYQSAPPWKRMIVISAGVVMNIFLALALFIIVFMAGLRTEPPVIGMAIPGSPASRAVAVNAGELRVTHPGLFPGDRVTLLNGERPRKFNDLLLAVSMSKKGHPIDLTVERKGVAAPLRFSITPEVGKATGLLELGVEPARSAALLDARTQEDSDAFVQVLEKQGVRGVKPGMTLASVNGVPIGAAGAYALVDAARQSQGGKPFTAEFSQGSATVSVTLTPYPELQQGLVELPGSSASGEATPRGVAEHLLGLMPVMKVVDASERAKKFGLQSGDVFARIGAVEFPSVPQGMAEIQSRRGRDVELVVLRRGTDGVAREVELTARVSAKGVIGFSAGDTADDDTLISLPLDKVAEIREGASAKPTAASGVFTVPGSRIISIDGAPIANFAAIRRVLSSSASRAPHEVVVEFPRAAAPGAGQRATIQWSLTDDDRAALRALGYTSPIPVSYFKPEQILLKADNPGQAVAIGVRETHGAMLTVYTTFLRLFQNSVKIQHLKGPVGIAHIGTQIADRGFIWLLFFFAMISVNLAVVNFLPLPIVDGGQFLLLLVEAFRGRPAPVSLQNALTLAGLVLIGAVFLIVTFNDVKNLLGV